MSKFYVTTPIYYVTDKPHIGHAYTNTVADVIARWHRFIGDDVFFLTGTDEHGEKIQKAADAAGKPAQEFVDGLAAEYKRVWERLGISYDHFIRTSDKSHEEIVQKFVNRVYANGDIYKGSYEGWYCVSDETFFTDLQLKEGRCPDCGKEVKWIKEESYFFRLSKYQDRLLKYYEDNPGFLSPRTRSDEIKNRVRGGLKDISITRSEVEWGIRFPIDRGHTIYVWVDGLLNYITALRWPGGTFGKFWPADIHVVGKEINWFHTVIWPALLFSSGIAPPLKVFAHGWWTVEGRKMSKSVGNVVDPVAMADKYSVDALRYFLIKEMPLGEDGDFSEKGLVARLNGELASDLGNLFYRVLTLAERFNGEIKGAPELEKELELDSIVEAMGKPDTFTALNLIFKFVGSANKYVNDKRPWSQEGDELSNSLYNLLEACRIIALLLGPFMPEASGKMMEQLGVRGGSLKDCSFGKFQGKVKKMGHLFNKVE